MIPNCKLSLAALAQLEATHDERTAEADLVAVAIAGFFNSLTNRLKQEAGPAGLLLPANAAPGFTGPLQLSITSSGFVTAKLTFGDGIKEEDENGDGVGVRSKSVQVEFGVDSDAHPQRAPSRRENGGAHPRIIDLTSDDENDVQVVPAPSRTRSGAVFGVRPQPRAPAPLLEPKEEEWSELW